MSLKRNFVFRFANNAYTFLLMFFKNFYRNNTKARNASALSSSASTSHGNESLVWILSLWLVISLLFSLQTMNLLAL